MSETVLIHGCGSEMQGVGRLADGRAVFVPCVLPKERVQIQITRDAGRFCQARLERILQPAAERILPACEHYGICGGCQCLHIEYDTALALKRQRVVDALERVGGIAKPNVLPAIGAPEPFRTRNKAEYPIRDGKIGAYAGSSHNIIPLQDCLLQMEQSVRALQWFSQHLSDIPGADQLRYLVTRVNRAGQMMLTLCGDAPDLQGAKAIWGAFPGLASLYYCQLNRRAAHALDGRCTLIFGEAMLIDELLGLRFELAPQAFFQVYPAQAEVLYQKALETVLPDDNVLDIYCGAGTITLAAARKAKHATGIEIVAPAVTNARKNAERNGLADRADFICGDAAIELPRLIRSRRRFDAAILDPPRKGADRAALNAIVEAGIERIAYVSCNPATLARDVKVLSGGGYRVEWAQPVDMFVGTGHVETVVLMSRVE